MEAILVSILSGVILFICFALLIAVPSMIITTGYKKGVYWLISLNVLVAALATSFGGILAGLCVLLVLLPFTYTIMYCMNQKIGFMRTVAVATFALILAAVAVYLIVDSKTSGAIIESIKQNIELIAPQMQEYLAQEMSIEVELNEIVDIILESMLVCVPAVLVTSTTLISLATYAVTAAYLNNKCDARIPYVKFELWDFPAQIGCSMILALLLITVLSSLELAWAESLMAIVALFYMLLLGIQGSSCMYFFEKQKKIPTAVSYILIAVVIAVFPMLIIILGVIDKLFRLRIAYMIKHGMIKVKPMQMNNMFGGFKAGNDGEQNSGTENDTQYDSDDEEHDDNTDSIDSDADESKNDDNENDDKDEK